jgi:hypothetical protein
MTSSFAHILLVAISLMGGCTPPRTADVEDCNNSCRTNEHLSPRVELLSFRDTGANHLGFRCVREPDRRVENAAAARPNAQQEN